MMTSGVAHASSARRGLALEGGAVPVRQVRRRIVGALEEREHRVDRRAGSADRRVGQDEYAQRRMVVHGTGPRDQVSEAWRPGRGLRVAPPLPHDAAPLTE